MGGGVKCVCTGDNSCSDCISKVAAIPSKAAEEPPRLADIMVLLQNINKTVITLTVDVNDLKENVGVQTTCITMLEASSRASSRAGSKASSRASSRVASCDEASHSQGPSGIQGAKTVKSQIVRVSRVDRMRRKLDHSR